MKIKSKRSLPVAIIAAILIVAAACFFYFIKNPLREDSQETSTTKHTNSSTSSNTPKEPVVSPEDKTSTPNTDTPIPTTSTGSSGKKSLQMVTSVDITGSDVYIRGGINNAVVQNGICFARLTGPNGESIRKDTTLLQNASTTDCKTITLKTSELSSGIWSVTLNYSSSESEGVSNAVSFAVP